MKDRRNIYFLCLGLVQAMKFTFFGTFGLFEVFCLYYFVSTALSGSQTYNKVILDLFLLLFLTAVTNIYVQANLETTFKGVVFYVVPIAVILFLVSLKSSNIVHRIGYLAMGLALGKMFASFSNTEFFAITGNGFKTNLMGPMNLLLVSYLLLNRGRG